LSDFNET